MKHREQNRAFRRPVAHVVLAALCATLAAAAQETPMISGGIGFLSATNRGSTSYTPMVMPLVAVPLMKSFLLEGRGFMMESVTPRKSAQSDQTKSFYGLSYLQVDFLAMPHATLVAGKFLTPFGTYNERLTPLWIGNFQDAPMIFGIGTMNGAVTGGEVRGSLISRSKVSMDYVAYLSANVTEKEFVSTRSAGERFDIYFPTRRIEVGSSYGRTFGGTHPNAVGMHFWWEPWRAPLTVRSEYAHGTHAQGYWVETAYRLSQFGGQESVIGRAQPVFRMQQSFRNSTDFTDGLPGADTTRCDFGLDYYLPREVRINTSYARQFSPGGNGNIWETGLIYRFMMPAWPGRR